jgi:hypothetical protein
MTRLEVQQPIKISNLNGCLWQNFSHNLELRAAGFALHLPYANRQKWQLGDGRHTNQYDCSALY